MLDLSEIYICHAVPKEEDFYIFYIWIATLFWSAYIKSKENLKKSARFFYLIVDIFSLKLFYF